MRKLIKIGSIIFLITSFIFLLFLTNAFIGNPISKLIVKYQANKYIEKKYPNTDYYLESVFYSFKDSRYHAQIESKNSIDTYFNVSFNSFGKMHYDNYETLVTGKHNTFNRIDSAYREKINEVIENMPYKSNIGYGTLVSKDREVNELINIGLDVDKLILDKKYDIKELGIKHGNIVFYAYTEEVSEEKLKEILFKFKKDCEKNDITFNTISLSLQDLDGFESKKFKEEIIIESFLYSDIDEKTIEEKIKESIIKTQEFYDELEKAGY